jgi:SAM-dependent methyltransferase
LASATPTVEADERRAAPLRERCVACDGPLGSPLEVGAVTLASCDACGSRTAIPRPGAIELRELHDNPGYFEHQYFEGRRGRDEQSRRRAKLVLEVIRRNAPAALASGSRVLDVGCDTGDFPLALRNLADVSVFGIDVASRATEVAASRGLEVATSDIAAAPASFRNFKAITAIDLVEHLADPALFLSQVAERLAPDGVVFVETPNWDSVVYRAGVVGARATHNRPRGLFHRLFPAQHVQYFTARGLRRLAERAGYEVLEVRTRRLEPRAVGGGPLLKAVVWISQLPDTAKGGKILLAALLRPAGRNATA